MKRKISQKMLKISDIRTESDKEFCFLCADICEGGSTKKVWYRFAKQYEKYICEERADAFLVGILYYALIKGYDIVTDKPVSGRLLYQLERYYIPTLADTTDFFHRIKIHALTDDSPIENEGAVGTALSCGVDSFYSVLKTLNTSFDRGKLTHIVFTDIPATVFSEELKIRWTEENRKKILGIAEELNCSLVVAETNLNKDFRIKSFKSKEGFSVTNEGLSSLQYCGCIFALQKLFSVYYLASAGYRLHDVNINDKNYDVLWHDFLSMPLLSTENLIFYSDGLEASRLEKLDYLAKFPVVQKNLQVCALPVTQNCGKCEKCIRTMSELYVIEKLDLFKESFPVEEYKRKLIKNMAKVISHKKKPYNREILLTARLNRKHIPVLSYPLSMMYKAEDNLRRRFHNVLLFRKIYYGLNLDVKKYGMSTKEIRAKELLLTEKTEK